MATIKVDGDGTPYWEVRVGERLDFSYNWVPDLNAVGDRATSAVWSSLTSGLAAASTTFTASGLHTMWVNASEGNAGNAYYFASKVFSFYGRRFRDRIKVVVESWA